MQAINPTTTSAWSKLIALSQKHQNLSIAELFDQKDRFERYSRTLEDILVDYSKNRISDDVFEALIQLAQETALPQAIWLESTALKSYKAGEIEYVEMLQNAQQAWQIREQYLQEVLAYNQTVIQIETILGNE